MHFIRPLTCAVSSQAHGCALGDPLYEAWCLVAQLSAVDISSLVVATFSGFLRYLLANLPAKGKKE